MAVSPCFERAVGEKLALRSSLHSEISLLFVTAYMHRSSFIPEGNVGGLLKFTIKISGQV